MKIMCFKRKDFIMSKISPLMEVNARVRQTANALKKAADARFKLGGIPNVAKEAPTFQPSRVSFTHDRAVFPELPAPKGSKLDVLA